MRSVWRHPNVVFMGKKSQSVSNLLCFCSKRTLHPELKVWKFAGSYQANYGNSVAAFMGQLNHNKPSHKSFFLTDIRFSMWKSVLWECCVFCCLFVSFAPCVLFTFFSILDFRTKHAIDPVFKQISKGDHFLSLPVCFRGVSTSLKTINQLQSFIKAHCVQDGGLLDHGSLSWFNNLVHMCVSHLTSHQTFINIWIAGKYVYDCQTRFQIKN